MVRIDQDTETDIQVPYISRSVEIHVSIVVSGFEFLLKTKRYENHKTVIIVVSGYINLDWM